MSKPGVSDVSGLSLGTTTLRVCLCPKCLLWRRPFSSSLLVVFVFVLFRVLTGLGSGGPREGRGAGERCRDGGGHAGGPHRGSRQQLQVPDPLHGRPPPQAAGGGTGGPYLRGKEETF